MGRVSDRDMGYDHLVTSFRDLERIGVTVGVHEQEGGARPPDSSGATVAEYATFNEFGTHTKDGSVHVPERSFLRRWETERREESVRRLGKAVGRVLDNKRTIQQAFGQVALYAERGVRNMIRDVDQPANDPKTIRRKRSSNPLIDTGLMRRSIKGRVDR